MKNATHAYARCNFVLIADIIGRIIVYPYEINIGLTIGVFGTIIFLILLMKGRKIMQMSANKNKYTGRYGNLYGNFYLLVGLDFDIFEYQFQSRFKNLFLYY